MKRTIAQQVLRRIRAKRRAWVFTPKDFVDIGSRHAVDQALHRLSEQEIIQRLERGIYYFPSKENKLPDSTSAHIDAIARAIAAQTGDRAMLTGKEAARRMKLISSAEPAGRYDYLTTGRARKRNIGGKKIRFRHTSFSPPETVSDAAVNMMQALLYLGLEKITQEVMRTCARKLHRTERQQLRKLAPQAPAWLIPILHTISRMQGMEAELSAQAQGAHKKKAGLIPSPKGGRQIVLANLPQKETRGNEEKRNRMRYTDIDDY